MGTIVSRLSGLAREAVVAGIFGASIYFDAFLVAFRIPNLLRDMLAEGALSGAFTRVFTATYEEDKELATLLFWRSFRFFCALGLIVVVSGALLAPWLVDIMTIKSSYIGWDVFEKNATHLTRLMFPYLLFPILGSLVMGVLHRHGGFFITGVAPVLLNIGFILGALVFAQNAGLVDWMPGTTEGIDLATTGLAMGVLLGGFGQFSFQFYFARKKLAPIIKPLLTDGKEHLKKVLILMAPAAIAASAGPLTAFVNTNFATSLGEGAVSWLYYAFRILQLPVGVFAVAIGMAALPAMTRVITQANGKMNETSSAQLQKCIELVLWIMVPAAMFMYSTSSSIITLIFKHMNFSMGDMYATADALKYYSFGVIGYGLIKVMTSYYFAVERTRFAMIVSLVGVGVTCAGNYYLIDTLRHLGLALATSITLTFNALILMVGTVKDGVTWNKKSWVKTFLGIALAGAAYVGLQLVFYSLFLGSLEYGDWNEKLRSLVIILSHLAMISICFFGALYAVERKTPIQYLRSN